jgi:membrane protease YdiL (CAAX protease family)
MPMSILTYPFWNREERRLRAFWRLLLYLVVFGLLAVVFSLPQVLFAGPEILTVLPPWFVALGTLATLTATVVSLWFAARFIDRRRLGVGYGLQLDRRWWADFAFGSVLGMVLQAAIFGVSLGLGWIAVRGTFYVSGEGAFAGAILAFVVLFLCVGIYEELISRGYLMRNVAEGLSFLDRRVAVVLAWVFSSAVFGVLHATNPNASLVSTINLVLAGCCLACRYCSAAGWVRRSVYISPGTSRWATSLVFRSAATPPRPASLLSWSKAPICGPADLSGRKPG